MLSASRSRPRPRRLLTGSARPCPAPRPRPGAPARLPDVEAQRLVVAAVEVGAAQCTLLGGREVGGLEGLQLVLLDHVVQQHVEALHHGGNRGALAERNAVVTKLRAWAGGGEGWGEGGQGGERARERPGGMHGNEGRWAAMGYSPAAFAAPGRSRLVAGRARRRLPASPRPQPRAPPTWPTSFRSHQELLVDR
jgi:hypothetical protein